MKPKGFTLIEVLVAMSLLAVVAGVVLATFSGGARVWQRVRCSEGNEQVLALTFHEIRRELRNITPFKPIPVKGKLEELSFPVLLPVEYEDGSERLEPGRRGYYLNKKNNVLCRSESLYRTMGSQSLRKSCQEMFSNVEHIKFHYYIFDENAKKYYWKGANTAGQMPLSVKLEIRYRDECTEKIEKKSMVFHVPAARIG